MNDIALTCQLIECQPLANDALYCDACSSELEQAEIDVMDYEKKWGRCRLRLTKDDIKKHRDLLTKLLKQAYGVDTESGGRSLKNTARA